MPVAALALRRGWRDAPAATVWWRRVVALVLAQGRPLSVRRLAVWAAAGLVVLTRVSRVYPGAHYLSDMLAGLGQGVARPGACAFVAVSRQRPPSS